MKRRCRFLPFLAMLLGACTGAGADAPSGKDEAPLESGPGADAAANAATGAAQDDALDRFRDGLIQPERLGDGAASSLDGLITRFVHSIAAADTPAFRAMMLSRAEFAWLYYPDSPYTQADQRMDPDLLWFLITQNGEKGIGRVLRSWAGQPIRLLDRSCETEPVRLGTNLLWEACNVRYEVAGAVREERMFGTILERDGRFKFVSYANDR